MDAQTGACVYNPPANEAYTSTCGHVYGTVYVPYAGSSYLLTFLGACLLLQSVNHVTLTARNQYQMAVTVSQTYLAKNKMLLEKF